MLLESLDCIFRAFSSDLNALENIWFNHRLKILDNSLELLTKQADEKKSFDDDDTEESSCARCRVYRRRKEEDSQLLKKLKRTQRIHIEHNYSTTYVQYSSPGLSVCLSEVLTVCLIFILESDLILSLSKIADRIGHSTNLNVSNHTKKLPTSTMKKKQPSKLQSSISLIVTDSNKAKKRPSDDSRSISNSNFISANYDVTSKRQKRIGELMRFTSKVCKKSYFY